MLDRVTRTDRNIGQRETPDIGQPRTQNNPGQRGTLTERNPDKDKSRAKRNPRQRGPSAQKNPRQTKRNLGPKESPGRQRGTPGKEKTWTTPNFRLLLLFR